MRGTIDGASLAQMVIHAAASINSQKQQINELNVFPVPDGDTGTNMSLTIGTAAAELKKKSWASVGAAANANASALLRGARGNSGVILSLLFRGFGKALKDKDTADGADFAIALDYGVATAYKAVMKPAEGTILTVSRLCARRAAEAARDDRNVEYVLEEAIKEGHVALADTVNQNPVLKKAGVVDAGGKGFLIILQGMLDELRGEPMPESDGEAAAPVEEHADFGSFDTADIKFGYCTEFICSRDTKKDPEALRGFLNALGDSLVLVDDDEIIKVHVHTNHPGKVLEEAITYGALQTVKIENMRNQHTEILAEAAQEGEADQTRKIAPAEKPFGFVSVCAGAGLAEVFHDLGVDGIISGGQTMNPSTEDILKEIDKTPAEVVFVLPNNKNIIMAAEQCIPLAEGKKVVVLPTKTVPQGIAALFAYDPDADAAANTEAMTESFQAVKTLSVTYAARDSVFDGHQIKQGQFLGLVDGRVAKVDESLESCIASITEESVAGEESYVNVFYGEGIKEEDAENISNIVKSKLPQGAEVNVVYGGQPVYYYIISVE